MEIAARIEDTIAPSLADMGYDLVRVSLTGGAARTTLQIMAERRDGAGMTVDDCAAISRAASALLEVEDPIRGAYVLEVSSPGIDRPLTRAHDYERFAGYEAKVELRRMMDGRRRFRGRLMGLEKGPQGPVVRIRTDEGVASLPFGEIERAKLVLTDELLAAAQRASAAKHGR